MAGAHEPEVATLALLRDALPDDYRVFHGMHWTRQYKGRTLFREIDFVILNPAGCCASSRRTAPWRSGRASSSGTTRGDGACGTRPRAEGTSCQAIRDGALTALPLQPRLRGEQSSVMDHVLNLAFPGLDSEA